MELSAHAREVIGEPCTVGAWDCTQRVNELLPGARRVLLLVESALDRKETFSEIVDGGSSAVRVHCHPGRCAAFSVADEPEASLTTPPSSVTRFLSRPRGVPIARNRLQHAHAVTFSVKE